MKADESRRLGAVPRARVTGEDVERLVTPPAELGSHVVKPSAAHQMEPLIDARRIA